MANELIQDIVRREQELAARVAAEQQKARAWLEQLRGELAQAVALQRQALQQQATAARARAMEASQSAAEARRQQAETLAQRFAALGDDQLRPLILAKLAAILPARGHDHPDVEG